MDIEYSDSFSNRLTVRIDPQLHHELATFCLRYGHSKKWAIEQSVRMLLASAKPIGIVSMGEE